MNIYPMLRQAARLLGKPANRKPAIAGHVLGRGIE